ncbi:alpha/beta-hydrolase [Sistotremastrum suecicum HHB10207 ss-3]|uniref:Alpha/beta-hydrolase n=1 Tax=Sistotremastrum suecicum HHB10207 ss-3 TaxID=1314776 RepID=A0A165Y695_9AGAM|nr:alpha/beta-hydrolase [Sistotremastrum suecicum HHB10207 ss-3]
MLIIALVVFSLSLVSARPSPFLGFGQTSSSASTTPLSQDTISSTLLKPARFSQIAYCSTAAVKAWHCGAPCQSVPGIKVLLASGDNADIPDFYVAYDPSSQTLVIAHQGTDPENIQSIANDVALGLTPISSTEFPSAPSGVKVHKGFQETFLRTSSQITSLVSKSLTSQSPGPITNVLVTGHSLGAAIAVMDAIDIKTNILTGSLAGIKLDCVVFGLPRGGNQAWANFVDQTLGTSLSHTSNKNDPIPTLPPLFLSFEHPSGEIHITNSGDNVACPGQENKNCSDGNSVADDKLSDHDGPYFGVEMGSDACTA